MKQAKFTKEFDYRNGGKIIAYPAGYEGEIADAAYTAAQQSGALAAPEPEKKPKLGK